MNKVLRGNTDNANDSCPLDMGANTKYPPFVRGTSASAFSEPDLTFGSYFSPAHHMQGVSFPGAPTATPSIPRTTTPGGSPTRGCSVSTGRGPAGPLGHRLQLVLHGTRVPPHHQAWSLRGRVAPRHWQHGALCWSSRAANTTAGLLVPSALPQAS